MALFSDIDWLIIAAVAVFLLFGKDNAQLLRTFGRYYARAIQLDRNLAWSSPIWVKYGGQ